MHDWCHGPLAQVGQAGLHAIVADLADRLNQSTGAFKPATPLTHEDGEHDQAHQLRDCRLHMREKRLRNEVPKFAEDPGFGAICLLFRLPGMPVGLSATANSSMKARTGPLVEASSRSRRVLKAGAAATIMAKHGTRIQPSPGRKICA